MERIVNNYDFLLDLAQANARKQKLLLDNATPEQVLAVIDCVKLCDKHKPGSTKDLAILRRQRRWKRAVSVLKKNSKLVSPVLLTIICTLLREALFYVYSGME